MSKVHRCSRLEQSVSVCRCSGEVGFVGCSIMQWWAGMRPQASQTNSRILLGMWRPSVEDVSPNPALLSQDMSFHVTAMFTHECTGQKSLTCQEIIEASLGSSWCQDCHHVSVYNRQVWEQRQARVIKRRLGEKVRLLPSSTKNSSSSATYSLTMAITYIISNALKAYVLDIKGITFIASVGILK